MSDTNETPARDWRAETKIRNAERAEIMQRLGLSVVSTFVPFSQSRNKAEKNPSLNYKVTLRRTAPAPNAPAFSDLLTTDYTMGSGHCPASTRTRYGKGMTVDRANAIKAECEHGRAAMMFSGSPSAHGTKIEPHPLDVMHSLLSDADVIDSTSFEDWANNLGYDTDSRKAEAMYRQCLELALKMRNGIGEAGLAELAEAFRDY